MIEKQAISAKQVLLAPAIAGSWAGRQLASPALLDPTKTITQRALGTIPHAGDMAELLARRAGGGKFFNLESARRYATLRMLGSGAAGTPMYRKLLNYSKAPSWKAAGEHELGRREGEIRAAIKHLEAKPQLSETERKTKVLLEESLRLPGTGGEAAFFSLKQPLREMFTPWATAAQEAERARKARRSALALLGGGLGGAGLLAWKRRHAGAPGVVEEGA